MYQKPPGLEAALARDRELADKKQVGGRRELTCSSMYLLQTDACSVIKSQGLGAG
jgi:hypothetical protein